MMCTGVIMTFSLHVQLQSSLHRDSTSILSSLEIPLNLTDCILCKQEESFWWNKAIIKFLSRWWWWCVHFDTTGPYTVYIQKHSHPLHTHTHLFPPLKHTTLHTALKCGENVVRMCSFTLWVGGDMGVSVCSPGERLTNNDNWRQGGLFLLWVIVWLAVHLKWCNAMTPPFPPSHYTYQEVMKGKNVSCFLIDCVDLCGIQ